MRRCFRLLKETQAPNMSEAWRHDFHHASAYVAKSYKDAAVGTREAYERDCKMQQDAKLWGERFDALHPPKPVDFLQCFLLEMVDRPGCPVFACERAVTGEYIKHNNNSGFVESHRRATPQAFSHFSFQASRGQMIIVDIQGVQDLYTDPQIHTLNGTGYGEGNLGVNGFALFFAAHRCTPLCARLGLTPFAKSPLECARDEIAAAPVDDGADGAGVDQAGSSSSAVSSRTNSATLMQRTWRSTEDPIRHNSCRVSTDGDTDPHGVEAALRESRTALRAGPETKEARIAARRIWAARESARWVMTITLDNLPPWAAAEVPVDSPCSSRAWLNDLVPITADARQARLRRASTLGREWHLHELQSSDGSMPGSPKPQTLAEKVALSQSEEETRRSFAPVHASLARFCACGGLTILDGAPDEQSACWHAFCAARGGDATAVRAVRDLCRGVVQDLVPGVRLASELPRLAEQLTEALARGGDISACVEVSDAYANPADRLPWLERALAALDEAHTAPGQDAVQDEPVVRHTESGSNSLPRFDLLERLADARLAVGDKAGAAQALSDASDDAAAAGKGKLSVRLAERAAVLCDEEEA